MYFISRHGERQFEVIFFGSLTPLDAPELRNMLTTESHKYNDMLINLENVETICSDCVVIISYFLLHSRQTGAALNVKLPEQWEKNMFHQEAV